MLWCIQVGKMKYLFVGGPADGEWRETGAAPVVTVQVPQVITVDNLPTDWKMFPVKPRNFKTIQYGIRPWDCGENIIYIYSPLGVSDFGTFQQLLKGYKP